MLNIAPALSLLLTVLAVGSLTYVCYRTLIGALGLLAPRSRGRGNGELPFLILVPARNEERVIAVTVACLRALDYPAEQRRIVVIADDCTDATADVAAAAGAEVLVKTEPARNKGETLRWALARRQVRGGDWQALVIFDADSRPATDFLLLLEGALATGERALQGRTESARHHSWISRAYALNATQRNRAWHLARERAGFPAPLTGTGICLARSLLDEVPWRTVTLTEDLEYSALIALAGAPARFLYDAVARIEQPVRLGDSIRQRVRWARGQLQTTLRLSPRLLLSSLWHRRPGDLDLALYLGLPSIVPFQMLLAVLGVGDLIDEDLLPFSAYIVIGVLALSLLLPQLALVREHRPVTVADWLAFILLMATWVPLAFFAAATVMVHTWRPTPHGAAALPPIVLAEDN